MGKRQEAALETRRRIIEAMRSLLEEKSADAINIEEITARAGVAKGSFYTYFKRKEDVITEIALSEYAAVKEMLINSSDSAYEQLCVYLKRSAEIIANNTLQVAQQWMRSVVAPLDEETAGVSKYRFDSDNIAEIIEKSIRSGELRADAPVEIMTEDIMNSYYGAVVVWCINRGEKTLTESMERFCRHGLLAIVEKYAQNNHE